jgi:hypothetical protein
MYFLIDFTNHFFLSYTYHYWCYSLEFVSFDLLCHFSNQRCRPRHCTYFTKYYFGYYLFAIMFLSHHNCLPLHHFSFQIRIQIIVRYCCSLSGQLWQIRSHPSLVHPLSYFFLALLLKVCWLSLFVPFQCPSLLLWNCLRLSIISHLTVSWRDNVLFDHLLILLLRLSFSSAWQSQFHFGIQYYLMTSYSSMCSSFSKVSCCRYGHH